MVRMFEAFECGFRSRKSIILKYITMVQKNQGVNVSETFLQKSKLEL